MRRFFLAALVAFLLGCAGEENPSDAKALDPEAFSDHACAVCGMLVRDQPAPRGQVVHRDGERAFTCSVADLLAYLEAPSPHGAPAAVFVEVLSADAPPLKLQTAPHAWMDAESAGYVVGVDRPGIMGAPVLVYRDLESAEHAATGPDATRLDFSGLESWWRSLSEAGAPAPHH
jgi:nitrous oxide reductase accessory protein NosL